jgi:hypothetical protein
MNEEFLKIRVNYAVVIKADFETIEKIKQFLASQDGCSVIFQRVSVAKLWVKEGGEG